MTDKLLGILFTFLIVPFFCSCNNSLYNAIDNYQVHGKEIESIYRYFKSIKHPIVGVRINLGNDELIDLRMWHQDYENCTECKENAFLFDRYGMFEIWEAPKYNTKLSKGLRFLGWNDRQLDSLRGLLKQANCHAVSYDFETVTGAKVYHVEIEIQSHDLSSYSYLFFDRNLTKDEQKLFKAHCSFYLINPKVAVGYSSPSFASNCMPEKRH